MRLGDTEAPGAGAILDAWGGGGAGQQKSPGQVEVWKRASLSAR